MARNPKRTGAGNATSGIGLSSSIDEMLLAAAERGDDGQQTGRYVITYKEGADVGGQMRSQGVRVSDARDFESQAFGVADLGDADAVVLPEINVAIVSDTGLATAGLSVQDEASSDSAILAIEPERFVFAIDRPADYLRGFLKATEAIMSGLSPDAEDEEQQDIEAQVAGATWGLIACRVPTSTRTGAGIKVAVLDTGMDLGHPDFVGRTFVTNTFVGQPVQDLHGHGTHCIGTAAGPKAPAGTTQRYGIAHAAPIFVGKVLSNSGSGSTAGVLAGMNWAIANKCAVISMSLGSQAPVQASYTAAGQAALNRGCLIIAAAGNAASNTGAPANSPTIMSVAALDPTLRPSSFSNFGKIEIAGPGRDIFSSLPRPKLHGLFSGTSMATPHVAGCAALWAQTSPNLRGQALWNRLRQTARPLPFPPTKVGSGLVQAPQ
jgi:subtilisin